MWSGLGYYRRAKLLHEGARLVVNQLDGELPQTAFELCKIPGIGRYTAGLEDSNTKKERPGEFPGLFYFYKSSGLISSGCLSRNSNRYFTPSTLPLKSTRSISSIAAAAGEAERLLMMGALVEVNERGLADAITQVMQPAPLPGG